MATATATAKPNFGKRAKKFFNSIGQYLSRPANLILVIFAVILAIGVVYPLIRMVLNSLIIQSGSEAKALNEEFGTSLRKGDFTFLTWPYLLANKGTEGYSLYYFWTPLYRSILMSLVACAVAVIGGGVVAFLITRTNVPFKKFLSTVFVFPYIMPSWSIAMFWVNFFKNTSIASAPGVGMLQSMTGICAPEWLTYGFWPSALCLGIHYAPFAYILIGGILRNMDANLEEAATVLKASRGKILRRITLPIVAPAIVSTVLLVFSSSISSYTVPYMLNVNKSFTSISIALRSALSLGKKGEGYVMSTVLMIFSMLILVLNNWFTKSRKGFTTVSGKSGQISKINLRAWKWPIAIIVLIVVAFFAIVPLISFVLESLESTPGDIHSIDWKFWFSKDNTVNDAYVESRDLSTAGIFFNKDIQSAIGRTLLISVCVSLICGTTGILIGYAVSKNRRSRFANAVGSLAFLPYLIPAMCFSTIFFSLMKTSTFSFLDVSTTGSEWSAIAICIICGGIKFVPFASRSGTNAMLQLSGEIEEAAIIVNTPWIKRMTRVIFPIQKASFLSGYLLPFISCMREYTLFSLLTSNTTLATNILDYFNRNGIEQLANGINLVIVVLVVGINLIVNKLTGASIDKGVGG